MNKEINKQINTYLKYCKLNLITFEILFVIMIFSMGYNLLVKPLIEIKNIILFSNIFVLIGLFYLGFYFAYYYLKLKQNEY